MNELVKALEETPELTEEEEEDTTDESIDLSEEDLEEAISEFNARERRFGR